MLSKLIRTPQRALRRGLSTQYLQPTHLDSSPPQATLDRLARYAKVSLATYSRPPFIISSGVGCTVTDSANRTYLDFSGGIAVNALGHSDPGVAHVLAEQAKVLVHNSNLWHNEWAGELAILLVEATKQMGGMGYVQQAQHYDDKAVRADEEGGLKVFFSNSGTEANEGAIKFARKWGKAQPNPAGDPLPNNAKVELVSFKDGFHGRSVRPLRIDRVESNFSFCVAIDGCVVGYVAREISSAVRTVDSGIQNGNAQRYRFATNFNHGENLRSPRRTDSGSSSLPPRRCAY